MTIDTPFQIIGKAKPPRSSRGHVDTACSKDISTHSCKLQLVNSKWKQAFVIRRASVCRSLVWPLEALGWLFVSLHGVCVCVWGGYRDPRLQGGIRVLQGMPYILWLQRANGFSQESWLSVLWEVSVGPEFPL